MTIRELKEVINNIPEEYLDGEVFLYWNTSGAFCYDEDDVVCGAEFVKENRFISQEEEYTSEERNILLDLYSEIEKTSLEEKVTKLESLQIDVRDWDEEDVNKVITDIVEFMFQSRKKGTLLIS